MGVGTYALTSLENAKVYIGDIASRNGLWIFCSQSDADSATVEITDTTIILIITGGTQAGTNTLTFADADKNTLTELVTAINALTGWTAGRIYHGSADSTDLVITGALSCLGKANKQTLKIEDNYFLEQLIDRATDFLERYCNRKLRSRTYTREIYYGSGYTELILDQYPVTRVIRVSEGRTNAFSIKNTSTDANFATVEVTSSALRAVVDGGTNEDDTPFTLSEYGTIDALITAIEALDKGWSCTAIATDTDSRDASELLIRPSMFVNSNTSAYIEIVNDDLTDYRLLNPSEDRNYGVLKRPSAWSEDTEYFIDYVAGFSSTPEALEDACVRLVALRYGQSQRAGSEDLESEKLGDYQYKKFNMADFKEAIPLDLKAEVDLFKKYVI